MPDEAKKIDVQNECTRSGTRRMSHDVGVEDDLPPTPSVVANRARIVTGRYSIVVPPKRSRNIDR